MANQSCSGRAFLLSLPASKRPSYYSICSQVCKAGAFTCQQASGPLNIFNTMQGR